MYTYLLFSFCLKVTTTIFSLGYLFTVAYYHYKVLKWITFSILCSYWEGQLTDKTFEKALISLLKMTRQLGFENKNLETACSQILLS